MEYDDRGGKQMTIEELSLLKQQCQNDADYYGNISFEILQGKFQNVVNILEQMEAILKENEELQFRIQQLESSINSIREDEEVLD